MTFTQTLGIITLILATWLFCARQQHRLKEIRRMEAGLRCLRRLEQLLGHLPQHRGTANALLNGDQSFLQKTKEMQQKIDHDIGQTDDCLKDRPLSEALMQRWRQLKDVWAGLKVEMQKINAHQSFERHSDLIYQLINLIGDVADECGLVSHPDAAISQLANTTFNTLPNIIEATGQARGIGTGAAAKGQLQTAIRIKLEFLEQRLKQTAAAAHDSIKQGLQNGALNISQAELASSQAATQTFIDVINKQLLGSQIGISASDFFSVGSKAFDNNFKLFETLSAKIDAALAQGITQAGNRRNAALLTALVISVILGLAL